MTATRSPTAAAVAACATAALLLLAPAAPATAQDGVGAGAHEPHRGFWLGGGLGGGLDDGGDGVVAGYLRLGGTLTPQLKLGGDLVGAARDVELPGDDATLTRSNATASLYYYPAPEGGFFVKGGLGFAQAELERESGDVMITTDEGGLGLTLGAGHDVQLGDGNLFLTPNFDVLVQAFDGADEVEALFLLTLGIGFR